MQTARENPSTAVSFPHAYGYEGTPPVAPPVMRHVGGSTEYWCNLTIRGNTSPLRLYPGIMLYRLEFESKFPSGGESSSMLVKPGQTSEEAGSTPGCCNYIAATRAPIVEVTGSKSNCDKQTCRTIPSQ